jgi:hypothetical protein
VFRIAYFDCVRRAANPAEYATINSQRSVVRVPFTSFVDNLLFHASRGSKRRIRSTMATLASHESAASSRRRRALAASMFEMSG